MKQLSIKILEALEFAAKAHDGQLRKHPAHTPYISHPAYVGMLLLEAGFAEEVIIAGILHDVVEDTPVTREDLEIRFGDRIAGLVRYVTEDKQMPWMERKEAYNRQLSEAPEEAVAISAADLLANRYSLLLALRNGQNPWLNFSEDPQEYTQRLLAHDSSRTAIIADKLNHPLVNQLKAAEEEVVALTKQITWE